MEHSFEWEPEKARLNRRKHGVGFDQGATVFADPRALSLSEDEHNLTEDRWITLGIAANGMVLVVHRTFVETDETAATIRIFSCRRATTSEIVSHGA